jgi:hypothetical protein
MMLMAVVAVLLGQTETVLMVVPLTELRPVQVGVAEVPTTGAQVQTHQQRY